LVDLDGHVRVAGMNKCKNMFVVVVVVVSMNMNIVFIAIGFVSPRPRRRSAVAAAQWMAPEYLSLAFFLSLSLALSPFLSLITSYLEH
jgi:hypothetical protein